MWTSGTASDYIDLLDRLNDFLTQKGSAFGLAYAGTGDGTLTAYSGGASSVAETFTITATSPTSFDVVGSVSGSIGPATVGTPFAHAKLEFLLTAGGTPFVAGDEFILSTAPPWTELRRALGCRVSATQGNTGSRAAQNLVDGKNATDASGLLVWRVDTPITIPQEIAFDFFEAETIATYQLAAFSSLSANAPSAWTFDYWNGSTWVTLDTQSAQTFGASEVKSYTIGSPVSASRYRLNITTIPFTNTVLLGAVRLLRASGVDAAFSGCAWKAPGNDGDSEIFVGAHGLERQDADYFNLELCSFDAFDPGLRFYGQAGYHGKRWLPLWDAAIPYWFIADGRRVVIVAKLSTQYEVGILGFADAYYSPNLWPYPMLLGAPIALGPALPTWDSTNYRWSNASLRHRAPTHSERSDASPDLNESEWSQLSLRNVDGTYKGLRGTESDGGTAALSSGETDHILWPYRCGLSLLDVNPDGSYSLFPVFVNLEDPNTPAELPGIAAVTGQGLTAETLIRKGAVDWIALPNVFRTDRDDWLAVALD